jgi:hypothetical protein
VINWGLPGDGQDRMIRSGAGGGPGIFPENCQSSISGIFSDNVRVRVFRVRKKRGRENCGSRHCLQGKIMTGRIDCDQNFDPGRSSVYTRRSFGHAGISP